MQKEIAKNKALKTLDQEVNWNTQPKPYPFNEVYVVWEEGQ